MPEDLAFTVDVNMPYDDTVEHVISALKEEGFGVLTSIDVKETLKKKLDEDFRPYVILGACNPPLAHRALSANPAIGVMLPCNVTIEQHGEGARVSIANPEAMMTVGAFSDDENVRQVAAEARARLERVAAALK